jgi:hypothetical protein
MKYSATFQWKSVFNIDVLDFFRREKSDEDSSGLSRTKDANSGIAGMYMVEAEEPKMHRIHRKHKLSTAIGMLALCIIAAGTLWAQGRGYRQAGTGAPATSDRMATLKQALNKAGATALDSSQESSLNELITDFRNAHQPGAPDPAEQTARDAYVHAILAKDAAAATSAADNLASLLSTRQRTMMEAETGFQIQALSVLNSDQVAALQSSIGNNGILRALQSLSRPGPGFGRGMMGGPGMMGGRGQMRPGNAR